MRNRRSSAALALLPAAALITAGCSIGLHSGNKAKTVSHHGTTAQRPVRVQPAAVEAGLLPWRLAAPLSREVVAPKVGTRDLLILGGLEAGGSSTDGVYSLNTHTGSLSPQGTLVQATHDAAGATLGKRVLVVGGGTAAPSASTQLHTGGTTVTAGALPQARADASAVRIGDTAYIVGGYDGTAMDREVVASTNDHAYRAVAALPVPVRYPAAAALGSRIYVFGGLDGRGRPVNAIQVVEPQSGTAKIVGRLPVPLTGAAAGVLDHTIYLAGGLSRSDSPKRRIYAYDSERGAVLRAGSLRVAVANAGAAIRGGRLWIVGGETAGGHPSADVQMLVPNRRFGIAGQTGAGSPFYGERLLIADRGNNRLLLLNDTDQVVWRYPAANRPAPRGGFYFPDDAFFIRHGTAIISNQEDNDTVVELAYPSGHVTFQYGHPRTPGAAHGYLNTPDDAYLLRNGNMSVADPGNCRVLILDPRTKRVVRQIGTPGRCVHDPPAAVGSPNGDTPLKNGNLLVSEINGSWIDEFTPGGRLVWDAHLPIGYPSDPQQLGPNRYLVADYERPGAIVEFDRRGRVEYRYQPASGTGALDHPSLVELLSSGVFMLNDDYNDRMVAIDPSTRALVWQYGHTGRPGTGQGMLNTPDGFDLIQPDGHTPTHPATG
jgi:outer membrane protein assembly factor BamB